jgi:hypothetical protein
LAAIKLGTCACSWRGTAGVRWSGTRVQLENSNINTLHQILTPSLPLKKKNLLGGVVKKRFAAVLLVLEAQGILASNCETCCDHHSLAAAVRARDSRWCHEATC